jgi:RNA polymerase sigma factor (TIGR02999 family)
MSLDGPSARLPDDSAETAQAFAAAYDELRRIARRQLRSLRPGQTLATTALVNEAFVKLADHRATWGDKSHFLALAARAMRQILVDYAREHRSQKRGGDRSRTTLDENTIGMETIVEEMLDVDAALTRLESVDERLARVVEWRFFSGMTEEEIAAATGMTVRTVRRDWQKARAFLYREIQRGS